MAAIIVGITEAKCRLPNMLTQVEAGNDAILTRRGKPVVRLALISPVETPQPQS